jgi:multidrug resistance efflux pump
VSEDLNSIPVAEEDFEAESELLPKDPPPAAMRLITDVVLGFFLVAAVFVVLVKLPATASGRFVLRPAGGVDPVNAPWDGVVEEARVSLGSVVEEGAVLFVLRAEDLRRLAAERSELREELRGHRERLAALRGEAQADVAPGELRARVSRLEQELDLNAELATEQEQHFLVRFDAAQAELRRRAREARQRSARSNTLAELQDTMETARGEGVASSREVLESRASLESARADQQEALRERESAESAILALESGREVELRERQLAVTRLAGELDEARGALRDKEVELAALVSSGEERLASLDHALASVEGDRLQVRAPWDGSVVALGVERAGRIVARGELRGRTCGCCSTGIPTLATA